MSFEYHNILVAIDGSKGSDIAFKKAIDIAKRNNANLILSHIIETNLYSSVEAYDRNISERLQNDAQALLKTYEDRALKANIGQVKTDLDYGSAKVKIAKEVAPKYDCDLIICGATGRTAIERFFIGSVSEHITRYAEVDVLIVKE
ncbi:universal stress protein [Bacillaceae bacterium W0354]